MDIEVKIIAGFAALGFGLLGIGGLIGGGGIVPIVCFPMCVFCLMALKQ